MKKNIKSLGIGMAIGLVMFLLMAASVPFTAFNGGQFNTTGNIVSIAVGASVTNITGTASGLLGVTDSAALHQGVNLGDLQSASTARANLGLGTAATQANSFFAQTANNLSDLASASTARVNLGLGTASTQSTGTFVASATGNSTNQTLLTATIAPNISFPTQPTLTFPSGGAVLDLPPLLSSANNQILSIRGAGSGGGIGLFITGTNSTGGTAYYTNGSQVWYYYDYGALSLIGTATTTVANDIPGVVLTVMDSGFQYVIASVGMGGQMTAGWNAPYMWIDTVRGLVLFPMPNGTNNIAASYSVGGSNFVSNIVNMALYINDETGKVTNYGSGGSGGNVNDGSNLTVALQVQGNNFETSVGGTAAVPAYNVGPSGNGFYSQLQAHSIQALNLVNSQHEVLSWTDSSQGFRSTGSVVVGSPSFVTNSDNEFATLTVGGSFATAFNGQTVNYTDLDSDNIVVMNAANLTNTLESAASHAIGREHISINQNTSPARVVTTSSQTINGQNSLLLAQYAAKDVASDGTNWFVKSSVAGLITTNFVGAQLYTNDSGSVEEISANTTLTTTGVAGASSIELRVSGTQTNTNSLSTLVTSLAATNTYLISIKVPPGSTYQFTNTSSGAGDSAAVSRGQILIY